MPRQSARAAAALRACRGARCAIHDRELALQLEAARLGALLLNPDLPAKFEHEADRFARPARADRGGMPAAFVRRTQRAAEGGPIAVAGDLAEEAAAHPALVSQGGHPLWRTNITICLVEAERYEAAEHILSRAIRHAERTGSPQWLARALWLRGLARHRRGDLRAAEADARAAVDIQGLTSDYTKTPGLVVVIDVAGRPGTRADEGEACSPRRGMDGELAPDPVLGAAAAGARPVARRRRRLTCGRAPTSRTRCSACGGAEGFSRGLTTRWVALVPVLRALGDDDAARAVAERALAAGDGLRVARAGSAVHCGCAGLLEGGKRGWSCSAGRPTRWPPRRRCCGARRRTSISAPPCGATGRPRCPPDPARGHGTGAPMRGHTARGSGGDELRAAGGRPRRRPASAPTR